MYSKLIREIKAAVTNSALPLEFLADLAHEYQEACESVHQRLTKIVGLLNAGYRDEAIELAEQNPNVLAGIYQLDFPKHPQWLALLADNQIDTPPTLPMEAAAELESAYETQRELEPIMKTHRMLALAQAPLQARILTLNKLAKRDPLNPLWPADCETLQRVRLTEIKREFKLARSKEDVGKLASLTAELQQPWSIPIPNSLLGRVAAISQNLARDRTRTQMIDVATALNNALVEYDDNAGRTLREQWHTLNKTAHLASDDEVALSAAEPLAWLDELDADLATERQYETALRELESAVDEQIPVARLERKMYEVQKFERDAPETLIHRTEQYRQSALVSQKRKTVLRVAAVAATLLLVIAITAWYLVQRSATVALADARSQMEGLVAESSFDAGHQFFKRLPPNLQSDGEILRLHQQLSDAESGQLQRQQNFEQLIAKFDLTGPLGSEQTNIIKEARLIAASDAEKKQVTVLENRFQSEQMERQNKRNAAFLEKLQPLKSRLDSLMDQTDWAKSIPELTRITREIETLLTQNNRIIDGTRGISSSLETNATTLLRRANLRIDELEKHSAAHLALSKLKFELSDFSKFARALKSFAKTYPTHSNADEFSRSADELETWQNFLAWQRLAATVKTVDFDTLSVVEGSSLSQRIQELNQKLEIADQQSSVTALLAFLDEKKKTAEANEDNRELIDRLKTNFRQSKFSNLLVLQRGREQFYLVDQINTKKHFKYFADNARTYGSKLRDSDVTGRAPHCRIAQKIVRILDAANDSKPDYNQLVFDMLDASLSQTDSKLADDPLVQCEFIDQILLFAKLTAPELKSFAEAQRVEMTRQNLLGHDWKAKCDDTQAGERRLASIYLSELAAKTETAKKGRGGSDEKNNHAQLKSWCEVADYELAGFICRENGQWIVQSHGITAPKSQTEIYVVTPGLNSFATIQTVGRYSSGKLSSIDLNNLQSGRPVYVRRPNK